MPGRRSIACLITVLALAAAAAARPMPPGTQMMAHAGAVKAGKVFAVPGIHLRVASQYMVMSANYFAGVVYEGSF